jgi:hypothetical protein
MEQRWISQYLFIFMFTSQQLTTLQIRHLIIHDVPNPRLSPGQGPTLSETESELDEARIRHLKNRLIGAIGSRSAYDIIFLENTGSPVPGTVRAFTHRFNAEAFVQRSQELARRLHEMQFGPISSGLLAIMDAAMNGRSTVVVLKIERQEGIQLELSERNGRPTFALEVLDNLVLTEGTRLFKAALFQRTGSGNDDFEAAACDSQKLVSTADDVAKFWLRFLGCTVSEQPRVRTQRFFGTVINFINEVVSDGIERNTVYEHLVSELKSQRRLLSPRSFMEDYVQADLRPAFRQYFDSQHVPMTQFSKDLQDISNQLKRRTLITTHGVNITAPVNEEGNIEEGLVQVGEERIVVNDSLRRVGRK